jgi:hypothetical protein
VASDLAVQEAKRNLVSKRPQWVEGFEKICTRLELVPSGRFALPVALEEKDVPLLCAAIAGKCQFFATGDKRDFGHLNGKTVLDVLTAPNADPLSQVFPGQDVYARPKGGQSNTAPARRSLRAGLRARGGASLGVKVISLLGLARLLAAKRTSR